MPAYLFGLGVLLLFEPSFGLLPLPYFFHPLDYEAPLEDPWMFVQAMVVPWIVLAAPFAAVVMRLTQAATLDELDADYVRTAEAKGLSRRRVIRRHAARPAYVSVASLVGVWVPALITNMVLVEYVFFVPGFFGQTKRALGQIPELPPGFDIPMLQGLALWAAVLIVVVSALADVVLIMLDPACAQPTGRSASHGDRDPRRALAPAQGHLLLDRPPLAWRHRRRQRCRRTPAAARRAASRARLGAPLPPPGRRRRCTRSGVSAPTCPDTTVPHETPMAASSPECRFRLPATLRLAGPQVPLCARSSSDSRAGRLLLVPRGSGAPLEGVRLLLRRLR